MGPSSTLAHLSASVNPLISGPMPLAGLPIRTVATGGMVNEPDTYPYREGMTLRDGA